MRRRGPEPDGILRNHQRKQISWVPFDHNMLLHIHAPVSAKIHIFAETISKTDIVEILKIAFAIYSVLQKRRKFLSNGRVSQ